jgi:hypothetical protein
MSALNFTTIQAGTPTVATGLGYYFNASGTRTIVEDSSTSFRIIFDGVIHFTNSDFIF